MYHGYASKPLFAQPHSSVGSVQDLRTVGRWFDPPARPIFFPRIATGFIPFSPQSILSAIVMRESSKWLGKNILRSTVE